MDLGGGFLLELQANMNVARNSNDKKVLAGRRRTIPGQTIENSLLPICVTMREVYPVEGSLSRIGQRSSPPCQVKSQKLIVKMPVPAVKTFMIFRHDIPGTHAILFGTLLAWSVRGMLTEK
ncbi:MAG: hypothetical protein AB1696_20945 [Planctomycetota bacterium]